MAVRWTEELCARLKVLWPDHSAGAISAIFRSEGMDFSRNAVIGIAHRLELTTKLQVRLSRPPRTKNLPALRCVEVVQLKVTLLDRADNGCCYIEGDDHLYCGQPRQEDSSYCVPHHSLIWMPAQPRRAAA